MPEEENISSSEEERQERNPYNKGGKVIRHEPTTTRDLMASPFTVSCFKHVGCFEFCEKVKRIQYHPMLTILFISNLHDKKVNLAGINFAMSTDIIASATRIQNVGERWFKQGNLNHYYYEPYLKPRYKMREI